MPPSRAAGRRPRGRKQRRSRASAPVGALASSAASDVHALAAQAVAHHLPEPVGADAADERDRAAEPGKAHCDIGFGAGDERRERAGVDERPALVGDERDERLAERDDVGAHA